jgi:RES domain-containing protein
VGARAVAEDEGGRTWVMSNGDTRTVVVPGALTHRDCEVLHDAT